MDLGTQPRTTAALLSRVGDRIRSRNALIIEEWEDITAWASDHIVTGPERAATITEGYLDTGVPIAGDGAPLVSEFALMELVAVLDRTPDGGKAYVGRVIECAWRLPNVYAAVIAVVGIVMTVALATRTTESLSVIHDRNPAYVRLSDGSLRNGYTIRIVNKQRTSREFALDIRGLSDVRYEFVGGPGSADGRRIVEVGPDQTREVRVLVTGTAALHATPIVFEITDLASGLQARATDYFSAP